MVTIVLRRKLFSSLKEHIPHILVLYYNCAHQRVPADVQDDQKALHRCMAICDALEPVKTYIAFEVRSIPT